MKHFRVGWRCIKYLNTNLNLANNLPNILCIGIVNNNIPIPAKHEGPRDCHKITVVAITISGPAHILCINVMPCENFKFKY